MGKHDYPQGSQMNSRLVNPSSVSDPVDLQYGPSGITSTVNTKQSYPQVFTSDYPSYPQATASQLSAAIPQAAQPSFMHQLVQDHPFASLPPQSLHSLPQRSINDQDLNQPRHYLQTGIQLQQPLMDNVSQQAFMHKPAAPFNGYSSSSSKVQPSKSQEIVDTHPAATKTETVYTQTVPWSYVPAKQLIQHGK